MQVIDNHNSFSWPALDVPETPGVGLKPHHQDAIFAEGAARVGWFEVHAENYMGAGGPPHYLLSRIRSEYPLSVHGVGLSIGGDEPLNTEHLGRVKSVVDRYQPFVFSEHLAWSSHDNIFMNDLLPLPYTNRTLDRVCEHIDQVQTTLGCRMLLENPSTYVAFNDNEMDEITFLESVVQRTGCGLLLDVNNVYVSSTNHQRDPYAYLDRFPLDHVGEIHLGGHDQDEDDEGAPLLIDSHDQPVVDPVWRLYAHVIRRGGVKPTLVEWDADIPAWDVLVQEVRRADGVIRRFLSEIEPI